MIADRLKMSLAAAVESADGSQSPTAGDTVVAQRTTTLDWDEVQRDVALIERRARAMRAEAVWSIAGAIREWVATGLGRAQPASRSAKVRGRPYRSRHAV